MAISSSSAFSTITYNHTHICTCMYICIEEIRVFAPAIKALGIAVIIIGICNIKSSIKLLDNYGISVQGTQTYICISSLLLKLKRWPADEHRSSCAAVTTYYRCFHLSASLHTRCMYRCPPTPFWQHLTLRHCDFLL